MPLDGYDEHRDSGPGLPIRITIEDDEGGVDITFSLDVEPQSWGTRTLDSNNRNEILTQLWNRVKGSFTQPIYAPVLSSLQTFEAIITLVRQGRKVDVLMLNQADLALQNLFQVMMGNRCNFTIEDKRDEAEEGKEGGD